MAASSEDPRGREDHHQPRQAAGARPPDHRLHRGRRHGPRHLGAPRCACSTPPSSRPTGAAQDRLGRGVRGREGAGGVRRGLPAEPPARTRPSTSSASTWSPSRGRSPRRSARASARLNVTLRQVLDLYVCLRPVRYFKGVPSPVKRPEKIDMVIFRENTEDIYAGIEWLDGHARGQEGRRLPPRRRWASRRSASPRPRRSASSPCRRRARSGSSARPCATRSRTTAGT